MNKEKYWKWLVLSGVLLCCTAAVIVGAEKAGKLSTKDARRLIARVAGIELKTDAVRVKDISVLGASAVVVAEVETAFRFSRGEDGKWNVAEIRTGDNRWEDIDLLVNAINVEKRERARAELEMMRGALEAFRRERGFYVVTEDHAVLIDQLSPRYMTRVVRLDPWHTPYGYEGTTDRFSLRSAGPDRIARTTDDVAINDQNR
ncbi:MAG: type II secretion system protein GspG [Pyrinomonadaceae bacterium]|nr:type II secretion system protein GspG [Pyrinomonadaceae bacterium]